MSRYTIALMKQAVKLDETLSAAAVAHKTVALVAHAGATKGGASALDAKSAPAAMPAAVSGMVSAASLDAARINASALNIAPGADKLPHIGAAIIAVAAKGALTVSAIDSV